MDQVQAGPNARIYYHSRAWALLAVFIISAASCWLGVRGWQIRSWLLYLPAALLMLGLLVFRGLVTARFRDTNWLVRSNEAGLFVQFRSYLNFNFPADDPTVVFIAYTEIRSARLVRQRQQLTDTSGQITYRTLRLAELELAENAQSLADALATERARSAPDEKRWYGRSSTKYEDYPVRMESPASLQIEWSVVPHINTFLEDVGAYVKVEAPLFVKEDYSKLNGLSKEEQDKRLKKLDAEGRTISAVYLAQQCYGCSLAEAQSRIEELRAQKSGAGVAT
jgi:hypothetical protein